MRARSWIPLVAAVVIAAVCVRLGVWQLDRLAQRRERNATIEAAFRDPAVPLEQARRDSLPRFRRVIARGQWDYARETTIPGRTRSGSPGVHIVTPMRLADGAIAFVNRGWVYSADARSVDLTRWHEGDAGDVVGYIDEVPSSLRATVTTPYIVALADTVAAPTVEPSRPARLSPPAFRDEGPHLNYAVQWFSFAAIALIGTPLVVRRQRRRRE